MKPTLFGKIKKAKKASNGYQEQVEQAKLGKKTVTIDEEGIIKNKWCLFIPKNLKVRQEILQEKHHSKYNIHKKIQK